MRSAFLAALCALIVGCATGTVSSPRQTFDEPADLTASGHSLEELERQGWEISAPVSASEAARARGIKAEDRSTSDGQEWRSFTAKLQLGGELRPVWNNAGVEYAIFRDGMFVDMFLYIIF